MKAEQENSSDNLIKKLVRESGYDHPKEGFTDAIMQRLEQELSVSETTKYRRLIPSHIWMLIGLGLAGIYWYLLSLNGGQGLRSTLFPYADRIIEPEIIKRLGEINWNFLDNINIHSTAVYAILMLSFFLYLQFILLKKKLFQ